MWAVLGCPYFFVSDFGLYAAVFFMQFMMQDIFGVVPIYLIELSPPAFRTFVVATACNLGILIASPRSSWIPRLASTTRFLQKITGFTVYS
jgi:SHS family lactate transporter-like MFS transporter